MNKNASDIRSVVGVQFGVLSPEEILRRSVVHVEKANLYENNGDPILGGLFDPRMGVCDRNKKCKTCELTNTFCPGHFGHIELAKPVFSFQFIYWILRTLKSICLNCSRLLVDVNHPQIQAILRDTVGNNQQRFMDITDIASKRKFCRNEGINDIGNPNGCGCEQPAKYTRNEFKIYAEWKVIKGEMKAEDKKLNLTPEAILDLFRQIPDEDIYALGFSKDWCLPHWLICTVLPVAPPSVRPSVRQYNNQKSEDDLTIKYIDIIKHNNTIRKKIASGSSKEETINSFFLVLQYHIATLIDNESSSKAAVTRTSRPLRTFKQRLHGKEGRIRGYLMGKRVDFSARSVITPDPNISIGELGVPEKIAMNQTFPETVNQYNRYRLYQYVLNGPNHYPGSRRIKKNSDGRVIALEMVEKKGLLKKEADELEDGDIVHRHIIDGDYVLFNRQPSLHKMSMMAHKVRVMPYNTFRLNVTVTTPYNADFDGDVCLV